MAYTPTNWTNFPSTATPVNASNLNKIENELVALDTGKADESAVTTALAGKVDKVEGKGLSTNDYDNTAKGIVDGVTTALAGKVDKVEGKGLSTEDYTTAEKTKLAGISAEANKVEITPVVTEGTTLATISIDGVDTDIKGSDIDVDDEMSPTSENPVQNKVITATLEDKADKDGNYEDMAVGQLLSNTYEEDKVPYNFRPAGGTLEIGDREYDTLVGGTVAFNQLAQNGNFASTTGWGANNGISISATNNELTVSVDSDPSDLIRVQGNVPATIIDHIYLQKVDAKSSQANIMRMYCPADNSTTIFNLTTAYSSCYVIIKATGSRTAIQPFRLNTLDTKPIGSTYTLKNCNFIDLTQMFGSTIADYIYSLEQATEGSGVAYFRSLFPKDYYDYNVGQLMSVKALSHKMVGFNAFNVTTGKAKLLGGNQYQITGTYTALSYSTGETLTPDSNGKFTPSASGELTVTGGNGTTCVHLVWDGERDGEYEAYEEHIYPLDSDLELRGIPKLDANNKLYYDGDTYESDGTVTRKYGIVDLGTLNWARYTDSTYPYFYASIGMKGQETGNIVNAICAKYVSGQVVAGYIYFGLESTEKTISSKTNSSVLFIQDNTYNDTASFKTAMSGVYAVFELAETTTETADTFQNPQLVDNWGTEEYTDSRTIQIPVGHITKYPPDLKAKLESAPDSPASDGDYILRHNNGENSYVALTKELPTVPTTDGTYVLKATVSSGTATLSWVAE